MPAWDNVSLAPPLSPQDYSSGFRNFLQLGDRLGTLPDSYFQGTQQGLTRAMQTAFPQGMPKTPDGQPDVNAIINKGVQLGGVNYAQGLIPFMYGQQIGDDASRILMGGASREAGAAVGRPNVNGAGTANLTPGASGSPILQPSAGRTLAQGDEPSVRGLAGDVYGDRDVTGLIKSVSGRLGVGPDDNLTAQEAAAAKNMLSGIAQNKPPQAGGQPLGPGDDVSGPPGATSAGEQNNNAVRPPFMGSRTTGAVASGAPGVSPSNASETASPATGIMPNGPVRAPQGQGGVQVAQAGNEALRRAMPSPAAGLVSPGADPRGQMAKLQDDATKIRAIAARYAANPATRHVADALNKEADARENQAKMLGEAIVKGSEPGQAGLKTAAEEESKYWAGKFKAIDTKAAEAGPMMDKVGLALRLANDPHFISGAPAPELLNSVKAAAVNFGVMSPKEALTPELFKKITADILTSQIRALASSGVGRVLLSEVQNMRDGIASLKITPASNRAQLEILNRTLAADREIGRLARQYSGGRLDAGFGDMLDKHFSEHPLFKPDELAHPELLGAPRMRAGVDKPGDEKKVWGLRAGDPYYTPSGKPKWIE